MIYNNLIHIYIYSMLMRSHRNVEFQRAPQVERYYGTNDLWGVASRRNYFKQLKDTLQAKHSQGALIQYRNDLVESNRTESYRKELDRIRNILDTTRPPDGIQTTEQLKARKRHVEEMIKNISD